MCSNYKKMRSDNLLQTDVLNMQLNQLTSNVSDTYAAYWSVELVRARLRDIDELAEEPAVQYAHAKRVFRDNMRIYTEVRSRYEQAKFEHDAVRALFDRASADFELARSAVVARIKQLKEEARRKQNDRRFIARYAGVPEQYIDNTWMSAQSDGTINIYFGGKDKPSGIGHGHYVVDATGVVTYRRDPLNPHGVHNFTSAGLKKLTRATKDARKANFVSRSAVLAA